MKILVEIGGDKGAEGGIKIGKEIEIEIEIGIGREIEVDVISHLLIGGQVRTETVLQGSVLGVIRKNDRNQAKNPKDIDFTIIPLV